MCRKFLIVGFGNIGNRYLQAIQSTKLNCAIYVYDVDKKKYYYGPQKKNIFYIKNLKEVPNEIDFCFFSSNSNKRLKTIKSILSKIKSKFIIIEKVLSQSTKDLKEILKFFTKNKMLNKTWVNTHYRTYTIFKKLINNKNKNFILDVVVDGTNWGLACNSIHYIDLYSSLFNSKVNKIDTSKLEPKWVKSKRKGFYEIYGELKVVYKNKKILKLICKKLSEKNKTNTYHNIKFQNGKYFKIHEEQGKVFSNFDKNLKFKFDPVSKKMKNFIIDIIKNQKCDLTRVEESVEQHLILISKLLKFWNTNHKKKISNLKIT